MEILICSYSQQSVVKQVLPLKLQSLKIAWQLPGCDLISQLFLFLMQRRFIINQLVLPNKWKKLYWNKEKKEWLKEYMTWLKKV